MNASLEASTHLQAFSFELMGTSAEAGKKAGKKKRTKKNGNLDPEMTSQTSWENTCVRTCSNNTVKGNKIYVFTD